jgi:RNA-directed DNA polymerase
MGMERKYPGVEFERYADDIIIHCTNHAEAKILLKEIQERLEECKLQTHRQKTKIVYCKQSYREQNYVNTSFTFLGLTFQPRLVRLKNGKFKVGFIPAISKEARKKIFKELRRMKIHRWTNDDIYNIAKKLNGKLYGWINYFERYNRSGLIECMKNLNWRLMKWYMNRYKRFKNSKKMALKKLRMFYKYNPHLFFHW